MSDVNYHQAGPISLMPETVSKPHSRSQLIDRATKIIVWNATAVPWPVRTLRYADRIEVAKAQEHGDRRRRGHDEAVRQLLDARTLVERLSHTDRPLSLTLLLGRAAIRQNHGTSRGEQVNQVHELIQVAAHKVATVLVLPESANGSMMADCGPFTLYEFDNRPSVAEIPSWGDHTTTDDPSTTATISNAIRSFTEVALTHKDSLAYMSRLAVRF